MPHGIEPQAGNPRPQSDKVLRRKKIIDAPLVPASEVREKDPATQAALVAAAWSGTVKGIIETGILVMASLRAFGDDADRRDAFIVALVEKRVLTSREARRRLASPKLIKLRTIGENQALLLHEEVFGFLSSSWLASFAALLALPYVWSDGPERVQWQGMLFQWAGVMIVAWGLADTRRKLFDKPPLLNQLWGRVRRIGYIIKPPPPIIASMQAVEAGNSTLKAHGTVRHSVTGDIGARVEALAKNQQLIDAELSQQHQAIDRLEVTIKEGVEGERRERADADKNISAISWSTR